MGASCGCEISAISDNTLTLDFQKNTEKTLTGTALTEEPWVSQNLNFHQLKFKHRKISSFQSRPLESFNISLAKSFQSNSKIEEEAEIAIFEGELLKYRPGISNDYIPKWCRLTREGFAYYKSQWSATCSAKNPLAFIPLMQVREVGLVKRASKKSQNLWEFEIFLMHEEELIKLSRTTDGFTIRKNDSREKVPGSWWSVRQVEWYSGERRLLFASSNKGNIKLWVDELQQAVKGYYS